MTTAIRCFECGQPSSRHKLSCGSKSRVEACGVSTLKQLVKLNPNYPAAAEYGLALEYINETKKS